MTQILKSGLKFFLLILLVSSSLAQQEEGPRDSYVLRPGDVVHLSVYQEPELETTTTIVKTGEVSFPLIKYVDISGLTLAGASEKIRDRYAARYIRNPRVTLTVTEYVDDFVDVIGRVDVPGKVPFPDRGTLDLRYALAAVGGPTALADQSKIKLKSVTGEVREFSYEYIQKEGGKIILKSGDQVIVNDSPFAGLYVSVIGEVEKPGQFKIPTSGKLDLASALALAGGLTELADKEAITLNRSNGGTASYSFASIQRGQVSLSGGDRVIVSKSRFADATVSVLGEVKRPGLIKFPLDGRLDLIKAIAMAGGITELGNIKKIVLSRPGKGQWTYNLERLKAAGARVIWLFPNDEVKVIERWL
jgi:polysaccharide export outer membrane protein